MALPAHELLPPIARTETAYFDLQGNPVPQAKAQKVITTKFDSDGNVVLVSMKLCKKDNTRP